MTLLEQALALRAAGATSVEVTDARVRASFGGQLDDAGERPTRESVRIQEARALLDAEAEERP